MNDPLFPVKGALLLATPFVFSGMAQGQSVWDPQLGNSWGTATNWTAGSVPASGGSITIADTAISPLLLDTSRTIGNLEFGDDGNRTTDFTLQTGPALTLGINGDITATGSFADTANLLNFRGNVRWTQNRNLEAGGSAGSATEDRGVRFGPAEDETTPGSLTLAGNLTKTGSGQLLLIGTTLGGPGNLIVGSGTLKLNAGEGLPLSAQGPGNLTFNGSSSLITSRNSGEFETIDRPIIFNGSSSWVHGGGTGGENLFLSPVSWQNTQHTLSAARFLRLGGAWSGPAAVEKTGAGTLVLQGSGNGFTGTFRSNASIIDRVRVEGPLGGHIEIDGGSVAISGTVAGNVAVSDDDGILHLSGPASPPLIGGNLSAVSSQVSGEVQVGGNITLNAAKLSVLPETSGTLKANGNLTLTNMTDVIVRGIPVSGQPFAVLAYDGSLQLGSGGNLGNRLRLAGTNTNYRGSPAFTANASNPKQIDVTVTPGSLTWTGGSNGTWSISATGNWTGASPNQFRHLDSVTFGDSGSNPNISISSGPLYPGVVTFSNTTAKTYVITASSSTATNCISGGARIVKNGNGTVIFGGGDNQDFTGDITVNAGTLRMGSNAAFGRAPHIHVADGAQVDINDKRPSSVGSGSFTYHLRGSGPGPDFKGALINDMPLASGSPPGSDAGIQSLVLDGDAKISSRGRFDVGFDNRGGRGVITGNNHLLTVVTDDFSVDSAPSGRQGMAFMGDASGSPIRIRVAAGVAWAQDCDHAFGGPDSTLTIASGARAGTSGFRRVAAQVVIENGGMLHSQGNQFSGMGIWSSGVTLQGMADIHTGGHPIVLAGPVSQAPGNTGSLHKKGIGNLFLDGDCSYAGATTVETGVLLINGHHGVPGSSPVNVQDLATLAGNGWIRGAVSIPTGAIITPGDVLLSATTGTAGADATGLLHTGALSLQGIYQVDIDRWNGFNAGADWDLLQAASIALANSPVIQIVEKPGDFTETGRTFVIATSATPITGLATSNISVQPLFTTDSSFTLALSGDGKSLLLRYGAGGTTAYDNWAVAAGLTGSAALSFSDPDADGRTNADEFLFGTPPASGTGAPPASVSRSGTDLILRWLQRTSGGHTYVLQENTTLGEGNWVTSAIVPANDSQTGVPTGYTRKIATIPLSGTRRFLRVSGQ